MKHFKEETIIFLLFIKEVAAAANTNENIVRLCEVYPLPVSSIASYLELIILMV